MVAHLLRHHTAHRQKRSRIRSPGAQLVGHRQSIPHNGYTKAWRCCQCGQGQSETPTTAAAAKIPKCLVATFYAWRRRCQWWRRSENTESGQKFQQLWQDKFGEKLTYHHHHRSTVLIIHTLCAREKSQLRSQQLFGIVAPDHGTAHQNDVRQQRGHLRQGSREQGTKTGETGICDTNSSVHRAAAARRHVGRSERLESKHSHTVPALRKGARGVSGIPSIRGSCAEFDANALLCAGRILFVGFAWETVSREEPFLYRQ